MHTVTPMEGKQRAKRLRAMRELAGYRTPGALAKAMKAAGYPRNFGERVLIKWEDPKHAQRLERHQLEPVARVCGVNYGFFTMDFSPSDAGELFQQELEDNDQPSQQQERDTG